MKKLLAILLALMLVMVSAFALAEEGNPDTDQDTPPTEVGGTEDGTTEGGNTEGGNQNPSGSMAQYLANPEVTVSIDTTTAAAPTAPQDVTITKRINKETVGVNDPHPAMSVSFSVGTGNVTLSDLTTVPDVTINKGEPISIDEGANTATVTINLPAYDHIGVYTYPVTENATNIAGVTEASNLELKVTVIQDGEALKIAGIAFRQEGKKTDEIDNLYQAGQLTVTKTVSGNLGDRNKEFPITITLTAPVGKTVASTVTYAIGSADASTATWTNGTAEIKVNLKHGETVTVNNIPVDVTYTVVEDSTISHLNNATEDQANVNAYKVDGEVTTAKTIAQRTSEETITNTKDITIDTGVTLETTAYMLIMALTMAGFAMMMIRRRKEY